MQQVLAARSSTRTRAQGGRMRLIFALLGVALGLFIALQPPSSELSRAALQALGLLVGAICFWIGRVFDDYVVALLMAIGWISLEIVPFETAFATFHSKTWWLMFGAMGLGLGAAKSGLLKRATLMMLKMLPSTYLGQSLALLITGVLVAPAIPSIIAKVSIAAKFIPELVTGMGLPKRGKASAGLFMSMYLGFVLSAPIFLTGSSTNLLMLEMLPEAERLAMTWLGWLKAAFVPGLLVMTGGYLSILLFMAPRKQVAADKSLVGKQLDELGPLSRPEKITLLVLLLSIVFWVTEGVHGISAVTVALAGLTALLATGVVDKRALQSDLGWSTLIFLGVILNLGTVFPALGIDSFLGQKMSPLLAPLASNALIFLAALMLLTAALRFVIVSVNALLTILVLVLAPIALQANISVWAVGWAVQFIGHAMFILAYQSATFAVASGASQGEAITARDAATGSLICVLVIVAAILLSFPWWRFLGLI